jgi:hypothetical protein
MANRGKRATKNHIKHAFIVVFDRLPAESNGVAVGILLLSLFVVYSIKSFFTFASARLTS